MGPMGLNQHKIILSSLMFIPMRYIDIRLYIYKVHTYYKFLTHTASSNVKDETNHLSVLAAGL